MRVQQWEYKSNIYKDIFISVIYNYSVLSVFFDYIFVSTSEHKNKQIRYEGKIQWY